MVLKGVRFLVFELVKANHTMSIVHEDSIEIFIFFKKIGSQVGACKIRCLLIVTNDSPCKLNLPPIHAHQEFFGSMHCRRLPKAACMK